MTDTQAAVEELLEHIDSDMLRLEDEIAEQLQTGEKENTLSVQWLEGHANVDWDARNHTCVLTLPDHTRLQVHLRACRAPTKLLYPEVRYAGLYDRPLWDEHLSWTGRFQLDVLRTIERYHLGLDGLLWSQPSESSICNRLHNLETMKREMAEILTRAIPDESLAGYRSAWWKNKRAEDVGIHNVRIHCCGVNISARILVDFTRGLEILHCYHFTVQHRPLWVQQIPSVRLMRAVEDTLRVADVMH
jgi:hypothetical protein